ncbi:OLC1v1030984C1 [Oldenlandia corymbosa var. corymbosa]|uniref:OLC1v1030984C1 n=1 Tax=Oldenlandia corymbosa var. corymbosa TaxID=529605 RepID=A0AAV1CI64_OLDCO|nr:OLC1v1030984C1 [Oldenlandia corymbosa var. corymbosa]
MENDYEEISHEREQGTDEQRFAHGIGREDRNNRRTERGFSRSPMTDRDLDWFMEEHLQLHETQKQVSSVLMVQPGNVAMMVKPGVWKRETEQKDWKEIKAAAKKEKMKLFCNQCNRHAHIRDNCFLIKGYPDWWEEKYGNKNHTEPAAGDWQVMVANLVQAGLGKMMKGKSPIEGVPTTSANHARVNYPPLQDFSGSHIKTLNLRSSIFVESNLEAKMSSWTRVGLLGEGGYGIVSLAKASSSSTADVGLDLKLPPLFAGKTSKFCLSQLLEEERLLLSELQDCRNIIQYYGSDITEEDSVREFVGSYLLLCDYLT